MAGPLRGGGVKGRAIMENITFSLNFFIMLLFEIKDILLKTTDQNMALLFQKL